jgi:hypothetical protein
MKTTVLILAFVALAFSRATAQVTLEVTLNQEEFLAGESLPLAVKITNQSGQQIHLGIEPDWLTFSIESADGFVVAKNSDVPVLGAFDLESSQMGTKRVDIAPYFNLPKPGRYTVTATLHIKAWGLTLTSPKKMFDVITGADLWSQDFGIPTTNGLPEMRRYTLEQASYLHSQMRLYMQLSDPAIARIYKTAALGQAVSFARPQGQVDRLSQLHVLWQSGAQSFDYCLISPDGVVINREIYDDYNTRPRLVVNTSGDVLVAGGVRRPKPGELPQISQPAETPPAIQAQTTSAPAK